MKKSIKIIIKNFKRIIITDYNELIDLKSDYILVDNIKITGKALKIYSLDEFMIEIEGIIYKVEDSKWNIDSK